MNNIVAVTGIVFVCLNLYIVRVTGFHGNNCTVLLAKADRIYEAFEMEELATWKINVAVFIIKYWFGVLRNIFSSFPFHTFF